MSTATMKNMSLENIAAAVSGIWHGPAENLKKQVTGVTLDSRQIEEGGLFFATKGERTNGHKYLPMIYEKGALCAIVERDLEEADLPQGMKIEEVSYIKVTDSFAALRHLAAWYCMQLDVKVVGITGSVGKTSTKEMVASVLSQKYKVLKTEGNFNNAVGLPLTVFRLREEDEVAVLEMGISEFGEMSVLAAIARPDVALITNIGQCHLENLGTRDGILLAKTEMFHYLKDGGRVVLNGSDDKLVTVSEVKGKEPIFFNDGKSSFAADIESRGLKGTDCKLHTPAGEIAVHIPIPGEHQVQNALAAAAVGQILGLTNEQIAGGIEKVQSLGGRSRILQTGRYTLIDDCYNANPVSMKAGLALLQQADTRKVAVLGDMFELGADEKAMHRGVGTAMKEEGICPDVLICIGSLASEIYEGAPAETEKYLFADKPAFIEKYAEILRQDDTVLLKASHGMGFSELVELLSES